MPMNTAECPRKMPDNYHDHSRTSIRDTILHNRHPIQSPARTYDRQAPDAISFTLTNRIMIPATFALALCYLISLLSIRIFRR